MKGCRLLLGLIPAEEEAIEEALYRGEGVTVVASGADAHELLALAETHSAEAVLLSAALPGLEARQVARLRAAGLRTAGLALSREAASSLGELDLDLIVETPFSPERLLALLGGRSDPAEGVAAPPEPRRGPALRAREGSVLAVIGSKGAPGSSELAASFAALVARDWRVLLSELDGDGGQLSLRLGADPREGSLLGLARALKANEPELDVLLSHWLVEVGRGWPPVLLGSPDAPADLAEASGPGLVEPLLGVLAASFPLVVCDLGQRLRRGGEPDPSTRLHRDVLASADAVLQVIGSRQEQLRAGLAQTELLLEELAITPEALRVVVNGQPGSALPRSADTAAVLGRELARFGLVVDAWLPFDEKALRASTRLGVPLALARPKGSYAGALRELVSAVLLPGAPQPLARKRRLRPAAEPAEPPPPQEVTLPWRR